MGLSSHLRIILIRFFSFFYNSKRSKVIFYHDLHSVKRYTSMSTSIKLFEQHLQIIFEEGYQIVSKITKEFGQVEICFDDAFLGIYDNIAFLKKNDIPFHLFVVTSYIGQENYMNKKQLLELSRLNFVRISSHSHTHRILNKLSVSEIETELRVSKEFLQNLLNVRIDCICFPVGKFNLNTVKIAKQVGYYLQYSSLPGYFYSNNKENVIRRSLVQFADKKEFKSILRGGDHILLIWYKFKHFNI